MLVTLPKKLPLKTNVLLYMVLSIIDINWMALLSNNLNLYRFSTQIPEFLSVILYRDFVYGFTLITFANVFLTASRLLVKVFISLYVFLFLLICCLILNGTEAVTNVKWNIYYECVVLLIMMVLTYYLGRWLLYLTRKERSA
ncbi:hypothetical protein GQF01_12690 [Paenibacillus sp. 5J-6]|uniref:Uncharacterized protein n=1 Tax=Paenibacillus silvestris TaxID=2606219 RepID=A0A6L8UXJ6_9BACL|nr:hypothetical protein [Paenibacillus silvestris]MZQ82963.1 hypothetical protein [Paenibacillus silvestris]